MKIKKTFSDGAQPSTSGAGAIDVTVKSKPDKIGSTTNQSVSVQSGGSVFYTMGERTPLSPVEVSPDTDPVSTPTDTEQDKSDFLEELEKDIVKSLNEIDNKDIQSGYTVEQAVEESQSNSDNDSEPNSPIHSESTSTQNIAQSIPRPITKRVDFAEEPIIKSVALSPVEGAMVSRPSNLPLQENYPNAPPRTKKKEKRDKERLLSVPNIKYVKPEVKDLRSKVKGEQSTGFAGNLMRRFSKYQI